MKKALAVVLAIVLLLGVSAVAASAAAAPAPAPVSEKATFLIIGAVPTFMWLTPLGLLAPVLWVTHKIVSLLAIITPPVLDLPLVLLAVFIRVGLFPLWGIIW